MVCARRSANIVRQHPWRLEAAFAMLGANAALTRHGRCQAWQRWIDAKASSSFSQWEVGLVRHDKIATGPRELPLLKLVAGLATNITCSFGVLRRDASIAP